MSEYWKTQDLEGNGLQTINQQYARLRRDIKTAYFLCVLFPFGAHQFYLKRARRGIIFLSLSIATAIIYNISSPIAGVFFLAEIIILIVDIKNMDGEIISFNKNLKMSLSLQGNMAPPKDFKGRYNEETPIDDYVKIKQNEITAFETKKSHSGKSRIYSFAEQEALLKEIGNKMENKKKKE
ncbi:MAG: TM2 domain-containing protein [Gammaproteobacteria bacterium]|nr:TM2 domain-containing protein [Gammaproteobacteria bacterium]